MRQCKVFVNNKEAGLLREENGGGYTFSYNSGYNGSPVCLAMPVRETTYTSEYLFPFFFNMLSFFIKSFIKSIFSKFLFYLLKN